MAIYHVTKEQYQFNKATILDVWDYCIEKTILGFDTETTGLDPHNSKVVMLQIGDYENQFVIDTRNQDVVIIKDLFENDRIIKIGHNIKFDYKMMRSNFGIILNRLYDTMIAEIVLDCGHKYTKKNTNKDNKDLNFINLFLTEDADIEKIYKIKYGLKNLVLKYSNITLNKNIRNQFLYHNQPFTKQQIEYGANDIKYLFPIRKQQLLRALELKLSSCINLENKFISVLADMEYEGILLDIEKWKNFTKINKLDLITKKKVLDDYVTNNPKLLKCGAPQLNLFDDTKQYFINWGSSKQVIKVLKMLGVDTTIKERKTGKIKDTCEEKHIKKYAKKYDFIPIYLDYKEKEKLVNTYGDNILKLVNPKTGRLHSDFFQILITGRCASNRPNLQNIPKNTETRRNFVAKKGYKLIIADYSAQEPKITADKCQDPALIDFFKKGDGDIHSFVASKMFSIIHDKEVVVTKVNDNKNLRPKGKTMGLGMDYGRSAYTIKDELGVPQEEAQKFIDAYWASFPTKRAYFDKTIAAAIDRGYIIADDVVKRRIALPKYDRFIELAGRSLYNLSAQERSEYFHLKGNIERDIQNYPSQSTAASMTKYAAILIRNKIIAEGFFDDMWLVNLIHDEAVLECEESLVEFGKEILETSMITAGKLFCKSIPMVVNPIVADYWKL